MNAAIDPAEITHLAAKLRRDVLEPIKERLIGKDEIVEVLGVALTAGENAFLLGPPGTGKSALVSELAGRLHGRSFDYLLTRFTEPSELFGPFDLRRLRDGDLVTNTEGMLPEADFVFLDELLNANSAILNSLLLALNERVFRRGKERVRLPMLMAVGASNRLPEDDALAALFDRFLLRVRCDNVITDRLGEVLAAGWKREQHDPPAPSLGIEDARRLQACVTHVDLTEMLPAYGKLISRLRTAGMELSDRRAVRLQKTIAASAVTCGRTHATVSDLWIMRYIWDTPDQEELLAAQLASVQAEFGGGADDPIPPEGDELQRHPMADHHMESGPDPEQLSRLLDRIADEPQAPASADTLSLVAARLNWVQTDAAREHLQSRVTEIRESIRLTQEATT
ncbi:AAA family ATPase [Rhodopirellula sp. SWK7]|uniref:AAA family ATPase n=1 Tax=Rhodopirellula sp. SWK7 TaxID=595460 RepID=UPI0002BD9260|nr:AAA family ATPase [Rhodopirellula sp. SWK7]EMI45093.1 ATPase associated with various cellular activities AAA_5 [Rhodopirellula sp. SWK7]